MHYVKDIFQDKVTEHAHNKFVRYSKGDFVGPLITVKKTKANIKIAASFHFVDELLILISKTLKNQTVHIKGTLVWNEDLSEKLSKLGIKYSKVTKSRGIFKYVLENDVNITDFVDAMNDYHLLVTIKHEEVSLTTKSSFPKPNKEFTGDFCKATFPVSMEKTILEEFAFDVKEPKLKQVQIKHRILVDDIVLPEDTSDFEVARREAKRVGEIERSVSVNGGDPVITKKKFNV